MHTRIPNVALIYFPVVVWYQTDRVMLQFGLCQDIPNPSHNLDKVYYIDMSGHSGTNWAEKYQWWIAIWNERDKHVLIGQPILGKIKHMSQYMNWYWANSKIFQTRFATYPNVVATSGSTSNMEIEQHLPHQSPSVIVSMHDEGLQSHAQSYEFTPQPHHH